MLYGADVGIAARRKLEQGQPCKMPFVTLPLSKSGGQTGNARLHDELVSRLLFLSLPVKTRSEVKGLGGLDRHDGTVGWQGKQQHAVSPAVTVWFGIE